MGSLEVVEITALRERLRSLVKACERIVVEVEKWGYLDEDEQEALAELKAAIAAAKEGVK